MLTNLVDLIYMKKNKYISLLIFGIILLAIFIIGAFIYITGGTTSFVHLMYIPILFSVFLFGIKAGIFFSIVAGLVLGPYMPLVVSEGIMQETRSWIFRIFMFIIIVLIVGTLLRYIREINKLEKKKAYMDIATGFPNLNKFRNDLKDMIDIRKYESLHCIIFEFSNREMISQYIDYGTSNKTFITILKMADEFFQNCNIYATDLNRFVIVISNYNCDEVYNMCNKFIDMTKKPMYIYMFPISVIIKGGIVNYPAHGKDVNDIILKLEKVSGQLSKTKNDIIVYDDKMEANQTKYYNTLLSIYHSLQNDMFTLVFQPKVRITNNKIMGVEALLRAKDSAWNISIPQLIKMAEEVGFISEITKWVINNSISEITKWKDRGFEIKVAINLSPLDLKNDSVIEYTKECLNSYGVDPSLLEFELTERTVIEDEHRVIESLNKIKEAGIILSLDDYGSGYNTLSYLTNPSVQFDYIKIDKTFIDNITGEPSKLLCEGIIKTAHALGIEVIAEGVETEEQVNILKEIGCDIIQGYYFYKPMSMDELVSRLFLTFPESRDEKHG